MAFCSNCGNTITDDTLFCGKCGEKQEITPPVTPTPPPQNISPPPVTNPTAPVTNPTAPPAVAVEIPSYVPEETPLPEESQVYQESGDFESKSPVKTILAVVLSIVFILGVGGGSGYFLWNHLNSDSDSSSSASKEDDEDSESDEDGESDENGEVFEENGGETAENRPETAVTVKINQVDSQNFPTVRLYASITDSTGLAVDLVEMTDFSITEVVDSASSQGMTVSSVKQLKNETVSMNLVLNTGETMGQSEKLANARGGAAVFLSTLSNTAVELTIFNDFVMVPYAFTTELSAMTSTVQNISSLGGGSALYDATSSALLQTHEQSGAKAVVIATDSNDTASNYSYQNVVSLAQNTGIPVYIIGIGEGLDQNTLQNLANECGGAYYSCSVGGLTAEITAVFEEIHTKISSQYLLEYTSTTTANQDVFRSITLANSSESPLKGTGDVNYIPIADISGSFQEDYASVDYILSDSSTKVLTDADLSGLSLAQLRIARNEIYARHGRMFLDPMLNQWFYAKDWYLAIGTKYSPNQFNQMSSPLSKIEQDNIQVIIKYENYITDYELIFPHASTELLADYDMALTDAVLKQALSQMDYMEQTDILSQNRQLINAVIGG